MTTATKRITGEYIMSKEKIEAIVPHHAKKIEGRVRLEIDFPNLQAMVEWFEECKGLTLPHNVALYHRDGLDKAITENNTFVVKREGDRPDIMRLHIRTTTEEVV